MGNYCMTVTGVGAHHNKDYEFDADKLFAEFVSNLRKAGHTISHASFTHGGAEILTGPVIMYETVRKEPSTAEPPSG